MTYACIIDSSVNDKLDSHNNKSENGYVHTDFTDFVGDGLEFTLEWSILFLNVKFLLSHA